MNVNRLTLEAYSSGTTRVVDSANELALASGAEFDTGYSGGLYLTGSFFVPRRVTTQWALKGNQRVVMRDGQTVVYEGYIDGFENAVGMGAEQGTKVLLTGAWDKIAMRRRLLKIWSDQRLEDEVWRYITTASGAEKCNVDRTSRIRFTPKAEAWANGEGAAVRYVQPSGQTTKRIKYVYHFAEGAQAWEISIWRSTDNITYTQMTAASGETYTFGTTTVITADATATIDVTLATPSRYVELRFYSRAAQTPTSDGAIYGQFSALTIFSETGNINLLEVTGDIVDAVTTISSDKTQIDSNTQSLTPFFSANETLADLLAGAASFGDSSGNRWAVGFMGSEKTATPDGKPVIFAKQYPALTDYDYALRIDEACLAGPVSLVQDFSDLYNYIVVEYQDENGWSTYIFPADQPTLTDSTSITAYGQRDQHVNVGYCNSTIALKNGERYLAAHKDPQWIVEQPIPVYWIRRKNGDTIPSSHIVAGKRLRIENFVTDQAGGGTGLTVLITGTHYDDDTQVCTLSFGRPQGLLLQMMTPPVRMPVDEVGEVTGNEGGMKRHIYELIGFSKKQWLALPEERRRAIKAAAIRAKKKTGKYKRWKEFM